MPDNAHPHELGCRFNSLAGYYLFGGTPTVLDPRDTGRAATDLTNVHEQAHRDMVNNTLYGYVLRRLRDLQHRQEQNHTKIANVDRLTANLSGKVFVCAEGSATAMELLAAANRAEGAADALFAALPSDYQSAATLYLPFVKTHFPFPPICDFVMRASLIFAVTELALDWPISRPRLPTITGNWPSISPGTYLRTSGFPN